VRAEADGARADVSALIVNYGHHDGLPRTVAALRSQTRPPAEIILVDNDPDRRGAAAIRRSDPDVVIVEPEVNGGFAAGCNIGAARAAGALLFLANPDVEARPDCLERLQEVFAAHPSAAVVGAQVLLPGGRTTNAGANPVHVTGLSWSGGLHEPAEDGPDRPVLAVSGAALAVRRDAWVALGGFPEPFFTYVEDTDLCWRARLLGHEVRYCPRAAVVHEYEFEKSAKWFYLERNRLLMVGRLYSGPTLVLLAPVLLGTELAICLVARRGGWWPAKRQAYLDVWRRRAWVLRERRRIQAERRVPDAALWPLLTPVISSPLLAGPLVRLANPLIAAYARAVGGALR
jgi:GT2 family glycosyltransferase